MKKIILCILCMSLVFSLLGAFGISALEENRLDDSSLSVDLDSVIEYIDNNITVTENPDGSMQYTLKPVASSISISEVEQYERSTVITQAPLYANVMPDYTYTKNQTHTAIPMEKRYLYSLLDEEWKGYYRQIDKAVRNIEEGVDFTVDSESLRQKRLYFLYMFDNPELFYLASTITMYSYGNGTSGYKFVYSVSNTEYSAKMPIEELKPILLAKKERFQQAVNDFISTIPADAPEVVKENLIYSKILMNSYYNLSAQWDGLAEDNWTAYGIIYNGYGVCESYAEAFQTLCNAVGIQCTGVVGTAGGGHKWNAVNISGEWYQCDITFDDPIGGEPDAAYHYYFNLTDKQMSSLDHDWSSCDFTVPVCNGTQWGRDNFKAVFGDCTYGTMHYYLSGCDSTCENCDETRWISAHDYAETWTTSSTEHWKKCNNCDDITEKGKHTGGTATCTEKAVCSVCNEEYGTEGHTPTNKVDSKYLVSAATCTAKAVYNKSCSVCGARLSETFEYGDVKSHTPTNKVDSKYLVSAATCTAKAVYNKSCSVCGTKLSETFEYGSVKSHTPTNKVDSKYLVSEATCTAKAVYNKSCSVCGTKLSETFEYGSVKSHTPTNKVDAKYLISEATCTAKAVYNKSCSECGAKLSETFEYGNVKAHTPTNKVDAKYLVSEATCKSGAIYYKNCSICNKPTDETFEFGEYTDHRAIEKASSSYMISKATCISKAKYSKSCEWCGVGMIGTFEYGDFSGHTPTNKVDEDYLISEATYTEPAIYNKSCSICGVVVEGVFTHGDPLVAKNGWIQEDGIWYYYEIDVKVKNAWREDSNGWCFLDADGKWVLNTFVKDSTNKWAYITKDGYYYETTGWVEYDGHWYYLEKGYRVENDWRKDSTGWCFLDEEGKWVLNSFVKDSTGMWAYITPDGYYYETTGWIEYDGGWYYLEKGYAVTSQWRKDSIGWCYLSESGRMVTNDFVPDSNGLCYIGGEGYMLEVTDWQLHNDQWYYLQNGYAVTNDWRLDSKGWCYLGEDGAMLTSTWFRDSVGWCYIDENGYCLANGTYEVDGHSYYFDADGRIEGEPIQE